MHDVWADAIRSVSRGGVHGFDSTFPHPAGASSSASSFASTVGGGLNYALSRHISVRVVQIDYLRTYLPNNASGEQNSLRVGAGIVFRMKLANRDVFASKAKVRVRSPSPVIPCEPKVSMIIHERLTKLP